MADTTSTKNVLSLIATTSSRVKDLVVKNGQLIFIQDVGRIAMDFNNKRVFYNQIVELETDSERESLESPMSGYYFVINTAELWFYQEDWIRITNKPEEVVFIGVELPELGQANTLYINKGERVLSIWDEETGEYIAVSNYTVDVSDEDIENLFK